VVNTGTTVVHTCAGWCGFPTLGRPSPQASTMTPSCSLICVPELRRPVPPLPIQRSDHRHHRPAFPSPTLLAPLRHR
jgi:hypothetical protein